MTSDDIMSKVLVGFHSESQRVAVEHHHSTTVLNWSIRRDDVVDVQPLGVDPAGDLHLLKDAQVRVGLSHTTLVVIQASVVSVSGVV